MNHSPQDPILNDGLVLEIANKHTKATLVTGVEESGGEARAYYIDTDKVLKVQRPHRVRERTSQEREVLFLNELSAFPEIRVPRVLGYGRATDTIEYTLMSRMPGKALRHVNLTRGKRKQVLFALGQMLYYLHTLPDQGRLQQSGLFPMDDDEQALVHRLIHPLRDLAERISRDNVEWSCALSPQEIVDRASSILQYTERAALHSNPALSHTFVDPDSHTFTGLIDLGDAYISHPSNDLQRIPNPQDRREVFCGYNSLRQADDPFMSVWITNQLLSDLNCVAAGNEFRTQALHEIDEIVRNYL